MRRRLSTRKPSSLVPRRNREVVLSFVFFSLPILCSRRQLSAYQQAHVNTGEPWAADRRPSRLLINIILLRKVHKQHASVALINIWPRGPSAQKEGVPKIEMALRALQKRDEGPLILNLKWPFLPTRTRRRRPLFFCSPQKVG